MTDLEKSKIQAEIEKINAETAKIRKETKFFPATTYYGVVAGSMGALGLYLIQHFIK